MLQTEFSLLTGVLRDELNFKEQASLQKYQLYKTNKEMEELYQQSRETFQSLHENYNDIYNLLNNIKEHFRILEKISQWPPTDDQLTEVFLEAIMAKYLHLRDAFAEVLFIEENLRSQSPNVIDRVLGEKRNKDMRQFVNSLESDPQFMSGLLLDTKKIIVKAYPIFLENILETNNQSTYVKNLAAFISKLSAKDCPNSIKKAYTIVKWAEEIKMLKGLIYNSDNWHSSQDISNDRDKLRQKRNGAIQYNQPKLVIEALKEMTHLWRKELQRKDEALPLTVEEIDVFSAILQNIKEDKQQTSFDEAEETPLSLKDVISCMTTYHGFWEKLNQDKYRFNLILANNENLRNCEETHRSLIRSYLRINGPTEDIRYKLLSHKLPELNLWEFWINAQELNNLLEDVLKSS